ncbi:hypothetical protein [Nocardioides convexus]|uniref:hypothetical protein n=1 Tax=Nocardioides convexus TaxID=2712224 RepID=UPI00241899FB|nr:hypothetical protein [Nocardioides convexus]
MLMVTHDLPYALESLPALGGAQQRPGGGRRTHLRRADRRGPDACPPVGTALGLRPPHRAG